MSKTTEKGQPMDAAIRENTVGTATTNRKRNCYAMNTLIAEVTDLFPETSYEVSNYDGRNVAHDIQFDITSVPDDEQDLFILLMGLLVSSDGSHPHNADPRIAEVSIDPEGVLVSFRASARTQDDRSPFGLADAWEIVVDDGAFHIAMEYVEEVDQ